MKMATEQQVKYCRLLFRKVKFFYQCLNDADLRDAVLDRTGYDLDELEAYEAREIIDKLIVDIKRQKKSDTWFLDYDRWLASQQNEGQDDATVGNSTAEACSTAPREPGGRTPQTPGDC